MKTYFRLYKLFPGDDGRAYLLPTLDATTAHKSQAALFSERREWMLQPGLLVEECPIDEQVQLNGVKRLPGLDEQSRRGTL